MKQHFSALQILMGTAITLTSAAMAAPPRPTIVGKPEAASQISFEVALPLRNIDELDQLLAAQQDPTSPKYHHWLTPAQFGSQFGPEEATVRSVAAALSARGFTVQNHTRSLQVSGPVTLVESTFATHLQLAHTETNASGTRLLSDSALSLPPELKAAGATVMSFGPNESHVMSHQVTAKLAGGISNRESQDGGYWFDDLKQAYQYPSYQTEVTVKGKKQRLDGTGATIGVLMSSDYLPADVAAVFHHEKWTSLTGKAPPTLYKDVAINGGGGLYGGAFAEVSIDTQSEITGAPGAHVILYNIPDLSDGNIFAGYVTAIESNEVDALSASFGGCELTYFPQYNGGQDYRGILRAYDELFKQGNSQGITFLASSGDSAGLDCPSVNYVIDGTAGKFQAGVENPADDPNVTAVGGTNLVTVYEPGSLNSQYATENAWSDPEIPYDAYGFGANVSGGVWGAGGGVSSLFAAPEYQSLVTTKSKQRSVPDIGMHVGGCPGGISILSPPGICNGNANKKDGYGNSDRSYGIFSIATGQPGGGYFGYIGTSLSSPEFASVLALLIEQKGRMGNINHYLYEIAAKQASEAAIAKYLHTEIPGFNGIIQSNISPTYNVSTGIGTPVVKELIGAGNAASAGLPQSPSNP